MANDKPQIRVSVPGSRIRKTWVSRLLKLSADPAVPCAGGERD